MDPVRSRRVHDSLRALDGLSVGDAFGDRFFGPEESVLSRIERRALPPAPWGWTDDTAMALSIVETLEQCGVIDPDVLARAFARRWAREPDRGYGGGAYRILDSINRGVSWRDAAAAVFNGQGSMGNGAGMRSAPIGAWFAGDLDAVVENARLSALPTHAHPDGVAGAIAVAVAASTAFTGGATTDPRAFISAVIERTPDGPTREGLANALRHVASDIRTAASVLGCGYKVISSDTIPFAILCAARHLHDYEEAMWFTVSALGDRDTTCAIVGGIVAMSAPIPGAFLKAREDLGLENLDL